MVFFEILKGVGSGLFVAFLGYAKSYTTSDFSPVKFIKTLVTGGIVGGISAFTGQTPTDVEAEFVQYSFITYVIDTSVNALWRAIVDAYQKTQ